MITTIELNQQLADYKRDLIDDVGGNIAFTLANLHAVLSVQNVLSALVHLKLGDHAVGSINADVDGLTVGLVSGAALDVDHVLLTVALDNLALLSLEGTAKDLHLILNSDGDRSHLIKQKIDVRIR